MRTAIVVTVVVAVAVGIGVLVSALAIGAASAMVLDQPFAAGWQAAWARPGWTLLWGMMFTATAGSAGASRRR